MKNLTDVAKLLGEENEKRLRDGITDLLLERAEKDLDDKYEYDYCIEFDDIFDEVKKEIKDELKEKLRMKYMESVEKKMEELFNN